MNTRAKTERAKWMKLSYILPICCLFISLTSCSKRYQNLPAFSAFPIRDSHNYSVGRFKTSYLADQIHAYFRGNINGPIAITTFANIDDLYQSSTFGRIMGEQLMSELSMRGYRVIELRLTEAMQIMANNGEFGLSRELATIRPSQDIAGIVVGTYSVSPVRVYVNARIIDPASATLVSAGSVEMSKTKEIARLLRNSSFPQSLERIPVRHLGYSVYPAPYYWPNFGYWGPPQPPLQQFPVDEGNPGEWRAPMMEGPMGKATTSPDIEGGSEPSSSIEEVEAAAAELGS